MRLLLAILCLSSAFGATRKITIVNYEVNGVKQWHPGTIMAQVGDDVEITLKNTAKAVHGYAIPAFKVMENVKADGTNVVKFKATKAGLFPVKCHLHMAHVGGQFLVIK